MPMETSMKESGASTRRVAKARTITAMGVVIRAHGSTIKRMALATFGGLTVALVMVTSTRDFISMT